MAEMDQRQRAFYQGLLGLGAGILANNAPSRFPGGGTQALGKGLQQGLQTFNQALTMEEKMDALREERALKGELEEKIPDLIAQARAMGVDEALLRSAEMLASVKPSAVVANLNNAMVKAQKDPRPELTSEQLIYTDPTSKRQFRIKSDGYLGEEIKGVEEKKNEIGEPFAIDDMMRQKLGLPNNVVKGREEKGMVVYYNKLNQPVTSFPEVPEPVIQEGTVTAIDQPGFEDQAYIFLNGKNQLIKKTDIKQAKEQAGYTYSTPDNMPEGASQLEEDPQGKRRFVDENYNTVETPKVESEDEGPQRFSVSPEMAQRLRLPANVTQGMEVDGVIQYFDNLGVRVTEGPKVQEAKKPFEYIDRATSEARFPALFAQMGENDAIEVNPETGKAQIIHAPGADSEDMEYREIVSADGKMRQQGYYSKEKGLVLDLGKTPVNIDKGLETKDKLKFLIDRHKKPSDRLQAMVSNYESISTAVGAGKPFDDLALIFYIAKMLDPTSVVREGEQMIIRNTGALPDKFISYFTRLKDGKAFTKDQRRNILEFAKRKMDAELKTYNQVVDGVKRDAGENRFNLSYENEVVPALGIIHDKMDTSQSFNKVMDSINKLEDPLGGEEKLNTEGDSGLKQIVFDAVNEAIDARSAKDSRKKTILSSQDGDSILE